MRIITILVITLSLSQTGCWAAIANSAIQRSADRKDKLVEYQHQEKMRELDLEEWKEKNRVYEAEKTRKAHPQRDDSTTIIRDFPQ